MSEPAGGARWVSPDSLSSVVVPPLKWAGGKRWLIPELRKLYAPHRSSRLVEPFAGGLSVALSLRPRRALLSDVNAHAINFYQWLQRGLVIRRAMKNDQAFYLRVRARFNALIEAGYADTSEAAEFFYYLNRTCYNGLCRFNQNGEFNVPFGRYAKIRYKRDFSEFVPVLRNWQFKFGDFEEVKLRKGDFLYVDPPYDVPFTTYSGASFRWEDQVRLVEWLSDFSGPVVASNQATPRIVRLYRAHGFRIRFVNAPRRISCTGDRSSAREILATKNL